MLNSLLTNKKVLAFVGGIVATEIVKSNVIHNLAVQGMAKSIKVQRAIKENIQNIKEEAEDLLLDEETEETEEIVEA